MDFVSLLITLAGLILLVGLYVMSRYYQNKNGQSSTSQAKIPVYKDTKGNELSSVLNDHPATDGSAPIVRPLPPVSSTPAKQTKRKKKTSDTATDEEDAMVDESWQMVLFIANDEGIDGDKILHALKNNGFYLGEKDIFHFPTSPRKKDSLFCVANGVKPWTLRPQDIKSTATPGLSLFMQMPADIDNKKAVKLFIDKAQRLAKVLNATLKNQSQRPFVAEDRKQMLASVS